MKFLSIVVISLFVISLFFGFTPTKADAGDFCWDFSNSTFDTSGTFKLGVIPIGGSHFLCSGVLSVTDPIVMQFPAFGNVEILDGKIYMTLSLAGTRNDTIGNDMIKATLDPVNLNGTFESIGVYIDAVELSEGTLTHIACP
mgnify:CR=1 FL=1